MAPRGRATQKSPDTRKTNQAKQSNQLSLPHQDDCKTRRDIKQRTTKHKTIITESHNGSNNTQQVNNSRTDSSLSHRGGGVLNAFYWYQIFALDSDVVEVKQIVQLAWKPSNYCNVSSRRNTLIKLTHYDETKKRAHDSQIVRATVGPATGKHQAPTHRLKIYVRAVIESRA